MVVLAERFDEEARQCAEANPTGDLPLTSWAGSRLAALSTEAGRLVATYVREGGELPVVVPSRLLPAAAFQGSLDEATGEASRAASVLWISMVLRLRDRYPLEFGEPRGARPRAEGVGDEWMTWAADACRFLVDFIGGDDVAEMADLGAIEINILRILDIKKVKLTRGKILTAFASDDPFATLPADETASNEKTLKVHLDRLYRYRLVEADAKGVAINGRGRRYLALRGGG